MRRVAEEMGIRAPSLYKHVANKEDIEAGLQERALRNLAAVLAPAIAPHDPYQGSLSVSRQCPAFTTCPTPSSLVT